MSNDKEFCVNFVGPDGNLICTWDPDCTPGNDQTSTLPPFQTVLPPQFPGDLVPVLPNPNEPGTGSPEPYPGYGDGFMPISELKRTGRNPQTGKAMKAAPADSSSKSTESTMSKLMAMIGM
jgi:hypothetical protein